MFLHSLRLLPSCVGHFLFQFFLSRPPVSSLGAHNRPLYKASPPQNLFDTTSLIHQLNSTPPCTVSTFSLPPYTLYAIPST